MAGGDPRLVHDGIGRSFGPRLQDRRLIFPAPSLRPAAGALAKYIRLAGRSLKHLVGRMPTCRETSDILLRDLELGLPESDRAAFDRHLEMCRSCRAYAETYRTTIELVRLASKEPSASLPADSLEALRLRVLAASRPPGSKTGVVG